jgi:hypothetical protein
MFFEMFGGYFIAFFNELFLLGARKCNCLRDSDIPALNIFGMVVYILSIGKNKAFYFGI